MRSLYSFQHNLLQYCMALIMTVILSRLCQCLVVGSHLVLMNRWIPSYLTFDLLFLFLLQVRVYVVNWWKGAEKGIKMRTLPLKTKGRKYTSLPTSIHDTLTHED